MVMNSGMIYSVTVNNYMEKAKLLKTRKVKTWIKRQSMMQ